MIFNKLYIHSKCPHCEEDTISYWQKISLIDYRYTYTCKKCGGTIQLPVWHSMLYLSEVAMLIVAIVKLDMSNWQALLSGVVLLVFISFVQLPFITIKG